MLSDSIGIRLIRSTSSPTGIVNTAPTSSATELSSPILVLPMCSACSSCGATAPTVAVSAPLSASTAPNSAITRARAGPPTRLTNSPLSTPARPPRAAGRGKTSAGDGVPGGHGAIRWLRSSTPDFPTPIIGTTDTPISIPDWGAVLPPGRPRSDRRRVRSCTAWSSASSGSGRPIGRSARSTRAKRRGWSRSSASARSGWAARSSCRRCGRCWRRPTGSSRPPGSSTSGQSDPAQVAARLRRARRADFPGRVLLGIGIGHPEATSHYARPLTAMREFLDGLDAADRAGPARRGAAWRRWARRCST